LFQKVKDRTALRWNNLDAFAEEERKKEGSGKKTSRVASPRTTDIFNERLGGFVLPLLLFHSSSQQIFSIDRFITSTGTINFVAGGPRDEYLSNKRAVLERSI